MRWAALLFAVGTVALGHGQTPNEVLRHGLELWRKPGAIQNHAACATCHSPDGIEIADYGFSDETIFRRAKRHLPDEDCAALVRYFKALRRQRGVIASAESFEARPLQPGGAMIPGLTPEERDWKFGKQLIRKLPTLMGSPIETLSQAKKAEQELLDLDVVNLPVGFPMNRLSEDHFRGPGHELFSQWFPEMPPAVPDDKLSEWYTAEDAYLAHPTEASLESLLRLHVKLVNPARMLNYEALSVLKFRALLVLQHRLRTQTMASPTMLSQDVAQLKNYNPIWEVGEQVRQIIDQEGNQVSPQILGMDEENRKTKLGGGTVYEQLKSMRLSWFWAGWLSDQGMYRTSPNDKTRLGVWLAESLYQDGPYPFHMVFADARRQAVISNHRPSWGENPVQWHRQWDLTGIHSFAFYVKAIPEAGAYRYHFLQFTMNVMRMNLLLEEAEMVRTGEVWRRVNARGAVNEFTEFILAHEPDSAAKTNRLHDRLFERIALCRERF